MSKKTSASKALVPVGKTTAYPIADTQVQATQIFRVPSRHPRGDGPWEREADKLAWLDHTTGLACTILRQESGVLGGYVGVTEDHPLYGYEIDAVPSALGISPHGGLDYAAPCESGPEETSICHPSDLAARHRKRPNRSAEDRGEDDAPLWWFGFECNKNHDLVPGQQESSDDLGAENGRIYRDEAYVYTQTRNLALQLKTLTRLDGDSGVPLDLSASSPPVGLDPERRR